MELHNKAIAIANLVRMGYAPTQSQYILNDWKYYQENFSLRALTTIGSKNLPCYESGLDIDVGGKFFMSCHYGSYPHVINSIAQKAKDKTLYVIVGSESDALKQALTLCAKNAHISIHFIDGGFGMLRQVKQALANHYPVFVEIDVPWGAQHECNTSFPFVGGQIKAKDALFRMIDRLGVAKNFVLSSCGQQSITVINYGDLTQAQCFDIFADTVRNSPQQYERLFQMHLYFEPNISPNVAIIWQGSQSQYIIHTQDLKAWTTQRPLLQSSDIKSDTQELIKRKIDYVVSL